jgi:leucyl-tRNA synthetase
MVLRNGRKMSKHLGNAVSPEELLEEHGADALRVAVLGSASPGRSLAFDPRKVGAAARELDSLHALVESCRAVLLGKERPTFAEGSAPSRAARALSRQKDRALRQAARFFEEYRPQAAIETLFRLARSIREFALPRLGDARLLPGDARILEGCLSDLVVGLAPAAPHLCEELRNYLGKKELVVRARWPGGSVERREERVLAHR